MKYQPPYGMSDPEAPYINGDPTIARQGSIPPAAAFEHPMRELVGVISKSKLNPTDADLLQMAKAVRSHRLNFSEDTGGVNRLVVAYDPPLTAYTIGLRLNVKIRNRVTGPTIINAGAGDANVVRANGAVLQDGDLPAGAIAALVYDGTSFQVLNFYGVGGGVVEGGDEITNIYVTKLPYVRDSGTIPGQIIAPFNPAFNTTDHQLVEGDAVLVRLNQTCPGVSTIRINALPPKPVLANDSSQCMQGDYVAGDVKLFIYDGASFYIDPNPLITASVTMHVPSQYGTFDSAVYALQRKLISKWANVTIKIAQSAITGPLGINHVSASQIIVAGTMIGPAPTAAEFVPGNPGQNLAMYRSRYGTEVHVNGWGIYNMGPGAPIFQDLLLIGVVAGSIGVACDGAWPYINESINCSNIACWGLNMGFFGHGAARLINCSATACDIGFAAVNGGSFHTSGCHAMHNNYHGYLAQSHSCFIGGGASTQGNAQYGMYCSDNSYMSMNYMTSIQNGAADAVAVNGSIVNLLGTSAVPNVSPARGTEGNMSSIVSG